MGTRNLILVRLDNEYKVAQYCQWDGYPTGQGQDICNFILNDMKLDIFKEAVRKCEFVSEQEVYRAIEECGGKDGCMSLRASEVFEEKYPEFHRNTGADILALIQDCPRALENSIEFGRDELFCEWAYLLDLDREELSVFRTGFWHRKNPLATYKFVDLNNNTMENLENSLRRE